MFTGNNQKPYKSFDDVMKARFGGKVYRLALSASHSCPNRDGTCGTGGCIFCSAGGSGDFAESSESSGSIKEQIERAKQRVQAKLSKNFAGYMAYFQSFTETYGDQDYLIGCFEEAAAHPEVLAVSIATRPDCLPSPMLNALSALNSRKPVSVELGLQTIHEDTARYINRCYELPVFEDAFRRLKDAGLEVIVHVIIGLPGEDRERTKETVRYLANLTHKGQHIDGIKLQLLHVIRGTYLAEQLPLSWHTPFTGKTDETQENEKLTLNTRFLTDIEQKHTKNQEKTEIILNDGNLLLCYNLTDYADLVTELVAMLPPDIAVHRLTGDAPKSLLLYPKWTADKKKVLNTITGTFKSTGRYQSQSFLKES